MVFSFAKNLCLGRVAPLAAVVTEGAGEMVREYGAARVKALEGGARRRATCKIAISHHRTIANSSHE